jgi:iron complex outermembrane recepter protein
MKILAKPIALAILSAHSHFSFSHEIEEVFVSASPLEKQSDLLNRPVNLLAGYALCAQAGNTLGETLNNQLGVTTASFGPSVGLPIIRGQSDNRVKVMQDNLSSMDASAASPDHAITLEPLLATRIEVIRGPAALRYGGGAIGGVVNVIDNRIPEKLNEKMSGGIELRGDSVNDGKNAVGKLDASLGNIALHLDALKRSTENLDIPNFAIKDKTAPNNTQGFIANTDAKTESATLGASFVTDSGFIGISHNVIDNNYGVPPEGDEFVRIDMEQKRTEVKSEWNTLFSGVEKIAFQLGKADYEHTELEDGEAGTRFENDQQETRLEIIHSPWNKMQGAVGLQLNDRTFGAIGEEAFIPTADTQSHGIFLIEEILLNSLLIELGIRADQQEISEKEAGNIDHTTVNLSSNFTWTLSNEETNKHQINIALAQSQRAPSLEELLANGPHPATGSFLIGDVNLDKETSQNIELGYQWKGDQVQTSLHIFYNQFNDYIYANNLNQITDDLNEYQFVQADATFKGIEADVKVPLTQTTHVRLFSDAVRANLDQGGDIPRTPPARLGTELSYESGSWIASVSAIHSSAQNNSGVNEEKTESYSRIDTRIAYRITQARIHYLFFVKGTNLLDEDIRQATSYLRDIAPEAGRNIQLGVNVSF